MRESLSVPVDHRRRAAVEVGENKDETFRRRGSGNAFPVRRPTPDHRERVALAARHYGDVALAGEGRLRAEYVVELRDEVDHVGLRSPREVVLSVHVDLLRAEPLDAVRDSPRALPRQERRELHPEPRVRLALLRKAVVVVRLREVDERAELLAAHDGAGEIPLERAAVVCLEYLGVRPVEVRDGEEVVRELQVSAEPLEHEDGVGILLADARDDVLPRLERNHVPRVAAEPVDSVAAPEEEHVRHVRPERGVAEVELDEVRPLDAPRAWRVESSVRLAPEPVRMVRLQRRRPARVVRRKVYEE